MKNPIKTEVQQICSEMDAALFRKACNRFGRWMREAYGASDWEMAYEEMGIEGIVKCIEIFAAEAASRTYSTYKPPRTKTVSKKA